MHVFVSSEGLSYVSLAKELLSEGCKYILSEKLVCQDPLEQLFAAQRGADGSNRNPTLEEFNRALLVREHTKAVDIDPKRRNCRGGVKGTTIEIDETTLHKQPKK